MASSDLVGRGGGVGGWDVRWYYDTLTVGRIKFAAKMAVATQAVIEEMAAELEEYMKTHAMWEDRTGEARDGLTAEAGRDNFTYFINLYHTVDYGIWLEIRWSGRYAIILPTIETMGPHLMARLQGVFALL